MADASWQQKLDAYGRMELADGLPNTGVNVNVRVNGSGKDPAQQLTQAGLQVHYQVGDIFVGHITDEVALQSLASLPCVEEVQLSRPLYSEVPGESNRRKPS